jgi:low temperature requirement protein LtrA
VTRLHWRDPDAPTADRVTAVEVFFDVVFVFTLTQLTRTLEANLSLSGIGQVLLVFGVLWYMYGGYAWLTNHVPPRRTSQKLVLFTGMAGFFMTAIGIPQAFSETGLLFAAGYLVVVCVHLLLFTQSDALAGVARLAPYNIGGALLILAAKFTHGRAMYALWLAGYFLMVVLPYLIPRYSWVAAARAFHVSAEHFVERHGVLVMIALGESVIAIGAGVHVEHSTLGNAGVIVLALALPGAIWWTYFADYQAAEHALREADEAARSLLSVKGYYFAHIPILLGIVIAAAGIHAAVEDPGGKTEWRAAAALAGGVALFLAGVAAFQHIMSIGRPRSRVVAALVMLVTIPIGARVNATVHLVSVVAVLIAMLLLGAPYHHEAPIATTREPGGASRETAHAKPT